MKKVEQMQRELGIDILKALAYNDKCLQDGGQLPVEANVRSTTLIGVYEKFFGEQELELLLQGPRFELGKTDKELLQPYFDSLEASAPVYNVMKLALEGKLNKAGSAEKEALQQFIDETKHLMEDKEDFSLTKMAHHISTHVLRHLEAYEKSREEREQLIQQ